MSAEWPILIYAANGGHVEIVRLLLDRGVDPNRASATGMTPLIMNEGDPIQDVESLRLVLRSIFATPALAPVIDGLVQTLSGRPDLLASHDALVEALRATMMDQLKATPDSAELKRVLHAILDHELATAENRAADVPALHANPAAVRWPNPADPDHPRSIHAELPWAREHKIVDRSTPIGSAGSCWSARRRPRRIRSAPRWVRSSTPSRWATGTSSPRARRRGRRTSPCAISSR